MEWNASDVALLTALRTKGHSAGQIADRLGHSRNAVCAKLLRMGLKRGHKPPTSKTQDKAAAEAKAGVVGCLRPPGGEDGVAEDRSEAA
jgi:GcrA cell cycle regulator